MAKTLTTEEELQERLASLEAALAEKTKLLAEYEKADKGWLVVTTNPVYEGATAGIQFSKGRAYIPDNAKLPRFAFATLKATQYAKLDADGKAAYEAGKAKTDAQRAAEHLRDHFGYEIFRMTPETKAKVLARAEEIAADGAEIIKAAMTQAKAEGLLNAPINA